MDIPCFYPWCSFDAYGSNNFNYISLWFQPGSLFCPCQWGRWKYYFVSGCINPVFLFQRAARRGSLRLSLTRKKGHAWNIPCTVIRYVISTVRKNQLEFVRTFVENRTHANYFGICMFTSRMPFFLPERKKVNIGFKVKSGIGNHSDSGPTGSFIVIYA